MGVKRGSKLSTVRMSSGILRSRHASRRNPTDADWSLWPTWPGKITQSHTPGEMLLGGAQLMSGYCNDPERTAAVLREGARKGFRGE